MIIPNPIVKLNYDPATDVLLAEVPDFTFYDPTEARFILSNVVETVRHYNVHYLILDIRGKAQDVPDAVFTEIISGFISALASTNLRKLARLTDIGNRKQKIFDEIRVSMGFPTPVMHLVTLEDAMHWILSRN